MMTPEPLVSICCITYNHEKFIRQAIDGFLTQKTKFPIEILIHDDASTDATAEIIRGYEKDYPDIIKPIYQVKNQYSQGTEQISGKFNFPRAKGKYIALCEGDDYWTDPLKLQKQVDFLEANPDFAICFHKVKILENNFLKEDYITQVPSSISSILDLAKGNYIHTPSCVFRNYFPDNIGAHAQESPLGDYYLHMMNAQYGKIFCIEENMAVYRIHDNSVWSSQNAIDRTIKTIKAVRAILYDLSDIQSEARMNLINSCINHALYCHRYSNCTVPLEEIIITDSRTYVLCLLERFLNLVNKTEEQENYINKIHQTLPYKLYQLSKKLTNRIKL